jgi:GT2 family glycosyltransferase
VIPVYGERVEALSATLVACLQQTLSFEHIFVVDDGSPLPVRLPAAAESFPHVCVLRLDHNQGISAARNAGLANSNATFVAVINTEVLPDPDWLSVCITFLCKHSDAAACYTRLVAINPKRVLTRWRMRFLETSFGEQSGPALFAPGHAVVFRKEALAAVGGYDAKFRLHHEDSDICRRVKEAGWEIYYVAESRCISTQEDSLRQIAAKELRESYWYSPAESSLPRLYFHLSKWALIRAARNLVTGRLYFLPLDAAIWAYGLWIATIRTLRHLLGSTK